MEKQSTDSLQKELKNQFQNINDYYDIEEKVIGSGAFGEIKVGIHKKTNQKRAIKILSKIKMDDCAKFIDEIQMLKILDYPGIIKVFEHFEDKSKVYLVMEYCTGGDLLERIEKLAVFTEQDAKMIFRQMISAVNYCHQKNIVHRDLKPDNFMFESKDEKSSIKLIDFGLSKWYKPPQNSVPVRLKTLVGTSLYMAPEVLESNYSFLCDVWSCGIILYILLCGYPPFQGEEDSEIFGNIMKGELRFDSPAWDNISKEAKDLLTKMICKESIRFPTEKILNHEWLMNKNEKVSLKELVIVTQNMKKYVGNLKLEKALISYCASKVQNEDTLKLKNAFQKIDINGDGRISYGEFAESLKGIVSQEMIQKILKSIDLDNDGNISYNEFIAATIGEDIFQRNDSYNNPSISLAADKNKKIDLNEFKIFISKMFSEQDTKQMISIIDTCNLKNEKEIVIKEFQSIIKKIKH